MKPVVVLVVLGLLLVVGAALWPTPSEDPLRDAREREMVRVHLLTRAKALKAADSLRTLERLTFEREKPIARTVDSLRPLVRITAPGVVEIRGAVHQVPIELTALTVSALELADVRGERAELANEEADSLRAALAASESASLLVADTLTRAVHRERRGKVKAALTGAGVGLVVGLVLGVLAGL